MFFVSFIAQNDKFREVGVHSRGIIGIESPREEWFLRAILSRQAGESSMQESGDINSDAYHTDSFLVKF